MVAAMGLQHQQAKQIEMRKEILSTAAMGLCSRADCILNKPVAHA